MVNENLKPIIENNKPFELVQEIENYQIKKSPLSPAARSKVIKRNGGSYQSSRMSSEDIALMQMYGPGFWEGVWDVTKKVGGVALAVSYATPIAPFTITATAAAAGTAALMKEYGDETSQKIAGEIVDVVVTAVDTQGMAGEGYSKYRSLTRK